MKELDELKLLWVNMDEKLNRNWKLNMKNLQTANLDKVKRGMSRLVWIKGLTMGFYGLSALLFMTYAFSRWGIPHQAVTGIIFGIWSLVIFITSLHELRLITRVNYAEQISVLQKELIHIQLTIIKYLRLAVWVFPLYFGFIILLFDLLFGVDVVEVGSRNWIISNVVISAGIFLPAAIWMRNKLTPKNANKNWMKKLLRGNGSQVSDAVRLLEEINAYQA